MSKRKFRVRGQLVEVDIDNDLADILGSDEVRHLAEQGMKDIDAQDRREQQSDQWKQWAQRQAAMTHLPPVELKLYRASIETIDSEEGPSHGVRIAALDEEEAVIQSLGLHGMKCTRYCKLERHPEFNADRLKVEFRYDGSEELHTLELWLTDIGTALERTTE